MTALAVPEALSLRDILGRIVLDVFQGRGPGQMSAGNGGGRTREVPSLRPDLLCDLLQVEQRAPARWAAHVLGLRVAHPGPLGTARRRSSVTQLSIQKPAHASYARQANQSQSKDSDY